MPIPSLQQPLWQEVGKPDSPFYVERGYLFRKESVGSAEVRQLVIPAEKRLMLIKHAHSSVYSMHFAKAKRVLRL